MHSTDKSLSILFKCWGFIYYIKSCVHEISLEFSMWTVAERCFINVISLSLSLSCRSFWCFHERAEQRRKTKSVKLPGYIQDATNARAGGQNPCAWDKDGGRAWPQGARGSRWRAGNEKGKEKEN